MLKIVMINGAFGVGKTTVADEQYFSYVKEGLSGLVDSLHHFCLTASVATIHRRLAQRGDTPGSWTFQQTARCVKEYRKPLYAEQVDSEALSAEQIQDYVLRQISS